MAKSQDQLLNRVLHLRNQQERTGRRAQMRRIQQIMNGGPEGLKALLGDGIQLDTDDIPSVNLIHAHTTRLAQKVGKMPTTKIDPPYSSDQRKGRRAAERRERIIGYYDRACRFPQKMPQAARWLAGYGYVAFTVEEKMFGGYPYPHVTLHDPYDTFPGEWGPEQQPRDMMLLRRVPLHELIDQYPQHAGQLRAKNRDSATGGYILDSVVGTGGDSGKWENWAGDGIEVVEYFDDDGQWIVVPDKHVVLDHVENPLKSGPQFVMMKRFAFDELIGHYYHILGPQASVTRQSVLAEIAMIDSVFAEALALDTPIPTPGGWTTMGEIVEGDLVLGADGLPVEVIKATEVQEDRACYRVTFEDGTSVLASDGHLWQARRVHTYHPTKVYTTQQMFDRGGRFRVPAAQPWKLPEVDLPIDPYILGMWLGDGSKNNAILCAADEDMPHVVAEAERAGYLTNFPRVSGARAKMVYLSEPDSSKGKHGSGLFGALRTNGLMGNKHVPAAYLRGSIDQRLALVQGLMDTDGTVSKTGHCSFTNSNTSIADGMVELLRSLGEVPVKAWRSDSRSRSGGYWQVTFTARQFNPFRMARKAERVQFHRRSPEWVTIKSIEAIESVPVRCIAVANSDHLFLAGSGGHVTHNTNVYGDPPKGQYQRGRDAINYFDQNTKVERARDNLPFQMFQHIGTQERFARINANYPVSDDGQSPNSFATGAGIHELEGSATNEVREYQLVIADALEQLDFKRLEWMEARHPKGQFLIEGVRKGASYSEHYVPERDIAGNYRSRRVYGAMAAFEENAKVAQMLNLRGAGAMDTATLLENIDGVENATRILEKVGQEQAERSLMVALEANASQGDPVARLALVRIMRGDDPRDVLSELFTPEEPQANPETQAFLEAQQPQAPPVSANPAEVLARLTGQGATLGAQVQGAVA